MAEMVLPAGAKGKKLYANGEVYIATEGERAIFDKPGTGLHIDIFYEKLDFCHTIYWKDRLEVDSPTIPLTVLLLE